MKFNECSFVFLFIVVVLNRLTHVEVAIDWTTGQLSNELKIAKAEVRIFHKKKILLVFHFTHSVRSKEGETG